MTPHAASQHTRNLNGKSSSSTALHPPELHLALLWYTFCCAPREGQTKKALSKRPIELVKHLFVSEMFRFEFGSCSMLMRSILAEVSRLSFQFIFIYQRW